MSDCMSGTAIEITSVPEERNCVCENLERIAVAIEEGGGVKSINGHTESVAVITGDDIATSETDNATIPEKFDSKEDAITLGNAGEVMATNGTEDGYEWKPLNVVKFDVELDNTTFLPIINATNLDEWVEEATSGKLVVLKGTDQYGYNRSYTIQHAVNDTIMISALGDFGVDYYKADISSRTWDKA